MRNLSSIIVYVVLLSMTISCNVKNNVISKKVVYPLQTENFSFIATEREQDGFNYNIEEIKQNDEKLLRFVKGFIYLNFDESIHGIKKIDKNSISKYIDFDIIKSSSIFSEVSKYFG